MSWAISMPLQYGLDQEVTSQVNLSVIFTYTLSIPPACKLLSHEFKPDDTQQELT